MWCMHVLVQLRQQFGLHALRVCVAMIILYLHMYLLQICLNLSWQIVCFSASLLASWGLPDAKQSTTTFHLPCNNCEGIATICGLDLFENCITVTIWWPLLLRQRQRELRPASCDCGSKCNLGQAAVAAGAAAAAAGCLRSQMCAEQCYSNFLVYSAINRVCRPEISLASNGNCARVS